MATCDSFPAMSLDRTGKELGYVPVPGVGVCVANLLVACVFDHQKCLVQADGDGPLASWIAGNGKS